MKIYFLRFICLFFASISIILFWQNTALISLLLIVISILMNLKSKTYEIIYFLVISVLASIVESFVISSGAWIYSTQNLMNLPVWIPLYWGIGGIALKDVYLILKNIYKN